MADPIPTNLTAMQVYRGRGNPPSVAPDAAISNCFPGLEFDVRNVWRNIFVGIELHEAGVGRFGHRVVGVDADAEAKGIAVLDQLVSVAGEPMDHPHSDADGASTGRRNATELFNALAHLHDKGGQQVECVFGRNIDQTQFSVELEVRPLFVGASINEELAEPGALTQSLCSPRQADYRECSCYYWAASRPDYVNADPDADVTGHDWMQKNRNPGDAYQADPGGRNSGTHISYDDLYTSWEGELKFVVKGRDSE